MNPSLRILHVVGALRLPRDPDADGCSGAVKATLELARAQAGQGHRVCVASVGPDAWEVQWRGVRLAQLRWQPWARARVGGRRVDFSVHGPYVALTRREPFDVVHGQMYSYLRFLRAGVRVAHFHHNPETMPWPDLRRSARSSHAQVGVSAFVTERLRRRLPGARATYTVHNGVDSAHFDAEGWAQARGDLRRAWGVGEDEVVFLFAGAIVPEKGVLPLARAFARLAADEPGVHLAVAGDAGLWDFTLERNEAAREYHARVRTALGDAPPGRVHLLGRVNVHDIAAVYAACDVLVVPSLATPTFAEACPLVVLEGMASGRPVIGAATGGLPEVIGLGAGLLVAPDDEAALGDAMRSLVHDREARLALGREARERTRPLTWDAAARSLETIYRRHLGG